MRRLAQLLLLFLLCVACSMTSLAEDEVSIEGNTIRIIGSGESGPLESSELPEVDSIEVKKQSSLEEFYEAEKRQARLSRERREAKAAASKKEVEEKSIQASGGWDSSQQKYYPVSLTKSPQCKK